MNFKKMSLAKKLIVGFGSLVCLAIFLGGSAVISMKVVESKAGVIEHQCIPAVGISVDMLDMMHCYRLDARVYGVTGEQSALDNANKEVAELKKLIGEARSLAKEQAMPVFEKEVSDYSLKLEGYEKLMAETVAGQKKLEVIREEMRKNGRIAVKEAEEFRNIQVNSFNEEMKNAATVGSAKLAERYLKIETVGDVDNIVSEGRLANWQAQAQRNPEAMEKAIVAMNEAAKKLAVIEPLVHQAANKKQIQEVKDAVAAYQKNMQEMLAVWKVLQEVNKQRAVAGEELAKMAMDVQDHNMKLAREDCSIMSKINAWAFWGLLIGLGVVAIIGWSVSAYLIKSITGPINRIIGLLSASAEQTHSAASEVSTASQSLAEGASEQAASLEETSSSLEEMASMTRRNAENATEAKTLANDAKVAADDGSRRVDEMNRAMGEIKSASDGVAKIIKSIDEIAFQTNILALNAAVEAARAGEAGAGFAVVADEVRNLAQRSAMAAKETAQKIEDSIVKSTRGVEISGQVATGLNNILDKAKKVDGLVAEIATASQEQRQGIDQINLAVNQLDKVTQSNAANAEETASASEELSAQAEALLEAVQELTMVVEGADAMVQTQTNVKATPARKPAARVVTHAPAPAVSRIAMPPAPKALENKQSSKKNQNPPSDSDFSEIS